MSFLSGLVSRFDLLGRLRFHASATGIAALPAGFLLFPCLWAQTGIELRVADEVAPPGGTALLFVELTEPEPISSGQAKVRSGRAGFSLASLRLSQDGILGMATRVDLLSSSDDITGVATIEEDSVSIELLSPHGTFGTDSDLPIIALAVPVSPSALPGQSLSVEIDLASFTGPGGIPYTVGTRAGVFTVGGTAVSEVIPFRGTVAAGGFVTLRGVGFEQDADVRIEGADVDFVEFISSSELRVHLESGLEIRNTTRFRLRHDGSGSEDFYYPINERPAEMATSGSIRFLSASATVQRDRVESVEIETDLSAPAELEITSSDPGILSVESRISAPSGLHRQSVRVKGHRLGTVNLTARSADLHTEISAEVRAGSFFQVPVLINGPSQRVGLALTNRGVSSADIQLRGFRTDAPGSSPLEVSFSLRAHQQVAQFLDEFDPLFDGFRGWVEVSSESPSVFALFINVPGLRVRYPGAVARAVGESEFALTFPDRSGEYSLGLVNNSFEDARVTLDFIDTSGATVGSRTLDIGAQGSLVEAVRNLQADPELDLSDVALLVRSDQPLAGYMGMDDSPFAYGVGIVPPVPPENDVYLPRFIAGLGWDTTLDLVNWSPSACAGSLEIELQDGTSLPPFDFEIAPGVFDRLSLLDILEPGRLGLAAGSAVVRTACRASASALIRGPGLATSVPVGPETAAKYLFAQVANGLLGEVPLFTGLALLNPGSESTDVLIQVFGAEGDLTGQTALSLAAGSSRVELLSELIEGFPVQFGGHVFIEAGTPILVAEIFGDYALSFLSTVPASTIQE